MYCNKCGIFIYIVLNTVEIPQFTEGQERPQNILIFINPSAGSRKAQQIYERDVEPLFSSVGIRTDVIGRDGLMYGRYGLKLPCKTSS